ncbi:MAG: Crp/Fnr family transcriptional regulator [Alphaproteobacteria bacterium]|nr:MAG: Crp/Fnr family transcriptional regulator [Alphaproteobacteria bacterium]
MAGVSCSACPLRRFRIFTPFTPGELAFQQDFKSGELTADPRTTLLMEGSNAPQLFTVLSGMGVRYKTLENGRRQVISFVLPGDFLGLQAGVMGEMRHSVEATTRMRLCVFRREDLWRLFQAQPARAYDLTWLGAIEEHLLGETIVTLGQRDATQRIAWAFYKLFRRLRAVGLGDPRGVPLPFRQQDLADALGLSLVHTNKTLKRLAAAGQAVWSRGRLELADPAALAAIGLVDHHRPERRPLV